MSQLDTREDDIIVRIEEDEYTDDSIHLELTGDVQFCNSGERNPPTFEQMEISPELAEVVAEDLLEAVEEVS